MELMYFYVTFLKIRNFKFSSLLYDNYLFEFPPRNYKFKWVKRGFRLFKYKLELIRFGTANTLYRIPLNPEVTNLKRFTCIM